MTGDGHGGTGMTDEGKDRFRQSLLRVLRANSGAGTDPGEARERLARIQDRLRSMAPEPVRAAAGEDGTDERVVVEVDAQGALTAVEISPYGYRDLGTEALGRACTEALATARTQLADQLRLALDGIVEDEFDELVELPDDPAEMDDADGLTERIQGAVEEWMREQTPGAS